MSVKQVNKSSINELEYTIKKIDELNATIFDTINDLRFEISLILLNKLQDKLFRLLAGSDRNEAKCHEVKIFSVFLDLILSLFVHLLNRRMFTIHSR